MRLTTKQRWPLLSVLVAISAALSVAPALAMDPDGLEKDTETSEATAIIRVVCPADSGLANPALINDLLQEGQGAADVWDLFVKDFGEEAVKGRIKYEGLFEIRIETLRFSDDLPAGVYMADIEVSSHDKRLPAEKVLRRLRDGLASELARLERDPAAEAVRIERLARETKDIQARAARESAEVEVLERQLGPDFSTRVAEERLLRIDAERMAAQLRLTGLHATRNSLENRIAELAPKVAAAAKKDPVVIELEKVVDLREQTKTRLAAGAAGGAVAERSLREADDELAQARAEYAKQTRVATQEAGGLRLAELQRRLEDTEIERQESDQKTELLNEMYQVASAAGVARAELKQKKAMLENFRQLSDRLTMQLLEARVQGQGHVGPTVTLISLKTGAKIYRPPLPDPFTCSPF